MKFSPQSKTSSKAAEILERENLKLAIEKDLLDKDCPSFLKDKIIGSFYGIRKEDLKEVLDLPYMEYLHKDVQEYFAVLDSALESGNLVLASYATTFIEDFNSLYGFDLFYKCCRKNNVFGVKFLMNANKGSNGDGSGGCGFFNKQLQQQLYPRKPNTNPLTIAIENESKDVVAELLKHSEADLDDDDDALSSDTEFLIINTALVLPAMENID